MKDDKVFYEFYDRPNEVTSPDMKELPWEWVCELTAGFSVVKKYEVLYGEELQRFRKQPIHIYGLPFYDVPEKLYQGLDRRSISVPDCERKNDEFLTQSQIDLLERLEGIDIDTLTSLDEAKLYYTSLSDPDDYEIIWSRLSGADDPVPIGFGLLGYDVTYAPNYEGAYSIICDCMFNCKWHGCDDEGVLFAKDFSRLNGHGLFEDRKSAYDYMVKYLSQPWTERGIFGIYGVYARLAKVKSRCSDANI